MSRVLCKLLEMWVIISQLTLVCHQAQGQKDIFTKEFMFLDNYLDYDDGPDGLL